MADNRHKIGWIGIGRMGFPMAERLLKAGYDVSIWNRTRAKAEPLKEKGGEIGELVGDLAALLLKRLGFGAGTVQEKGGKIVDKLADLAGVDVLFSIVSTGK